MKYHADTSPVLLVEDNESDVALTRRAFRKNEVPCDLNVARDGEEALNLLFGDSTRGIEPLRPSLVLLDLKMPRMGGIEVLQHVRRDRRTRNLPVVILSSSVEERDLTACYGAGANSYVRKPIDFREFSDAIRQLGEYWLGLNEKPPPVDD